ncbi:probable endochitinase [Drosophila eugracilis]|uniref:probable endochitinase n=1 Tax=Drosophila eugracilis TaxID=29029 RepID=UPI0007E5E789|nr:probable endochitinase [Drosophila eugracilis]
MRGFNIVGIVGVLALLVSVTASSGEETTTDETTIDDTTTDESTTEEATTDIPTTTLPPPVLCAEGELFLPAPDCRQYYQCLYGEGILKICPDDLYWDRELNVCAWDSQYCTDEGIKTTESPALSCASGLPFLPYPPDCTKFIQCVYNIGIRLSCPGGLFWNQPLQSCDYTCDNEVKFSDVFQVQ